MNPIHIHNLLQQLSSEVKCPHCSAKVRPDKIAVVSSTPSYCMLKISCHACLEIFHGHAHVGVKVLPKNELSSLPSQREQVLSSKLPSPPPPISETDMATLGSMLEQKNNISHFFPS